MNHQEYERAANYWKEKDADNVVMDRESLQKEIESYIMANDTCALATGAGSFVRCTPIKAIKKLASPMNLIKITPDKIEFLNSEFKKAGFSSRQVYEN